MSLLKTVTFLVGHRGHIRTRRGPNVAREQDVVHHCTIDLAMAVLAARCDDDGDLKFYT